MTFTTKIKEEISKQDDNLVEKRSVLEGFLRYNSKINKNIEITLENASVTRFIYKLIKELFQITPKVVVRIQKKFKTKRIYILEINFKQNLLIKFLNLKKEPLLDSDEEKIAYLKGAFLGVGNLADPKTTGYHLEFILNKNKDAKYIEKLLNYFKLNAKVIKRGYKYITYIKMSESISDLIKMFKAIISLFEFEDTRIYRDHKNMVNRLNNCDLANQEKTIRSSIKQLEDISYLEKHNLLLLLDEKTKIVIEYRKKYQDSSFQELADIISLETDYKIGKSGINHHFRKIKQIKEKYKEKKE